MEEASPLLIFDFDHSLIDCNSDPWVVDHLGASQLMLSLQPAIPSWTDLMDRMMVELAACGNTVGDIEAALRKILLHPAMMRAIHAAHSWGWELRVISDANVFFIQTVLASHQLEQYFTVVHSNPAHINDLGVLRIHPYHSSPPHVCPICPPNMCKGLILDNIRAAAPSPNRRTIYVGDGRGDYCPSLRLREGDHVLAREGYPLWRLLKENTQLVKAKVHAWSSALDVESCLLHLYESEKIP